MVIIQFSLNFFTNSENSVTKIFVITVKGFELATSCVKRLGCYHSTSKTHTSETRDLDITISTPIHASMIYQIP